MESLRRIFFTTEARRKCRTGESTCSMVSSFKRLTALLLFLPFLATLPPIALGQDADAFLEKWFQVQTNLTTWSADLTQTRTLKALTQPLKTEGRVWFAAPDRFHWELGTPPQTIAIRSASHLAVIYPHLKRVERYPLGGDAAGQWRDALALLDAGFPRSRAEMESRFEVTSRMRGDETVELSLKPKSANARKMMPLIKIEIDQKSLQIRATELQFADGSTLRNDFRNIEVNTPLDAGLFTESVPSDYKVIEPLKRK